MPYLIRKRIRHLISPGLEAAKRKIQERQMPDFMVGRSSADIADDAIVRDVVNLGRLSVASGATAMNVVVPAGSSLDIGEGAFVYDVRVLPGCSVTIGKDSFIRSTRFGSNVNISGVSFISVITCTGAMTIRNGVLIHVIISMDTEKSGSVMLDEPIIGMSDIWTNKAQLKVGRRLTAWPMLMLTDLDRVLSDSFNVPVEMTLDTNVLTYPSGHIAMRLGLNGPLKLDIGDDVVVAEQVELAHETYGDIRDSEPQTMWIGSGTRIAGYGSGAANMDATLGNGSVYLDLHNVNYGSQSWSSDSRRGSLTVEPRQVCYKLSAKRTLEQVSMRGAPDMWW